MEQELQELRRLMNEAIRDNDGWLTHWYGSQIQSLQRIQQEAERHSRLRQEKYQRIKERSELFGQIVYDKLVFKELKPWYKRLFS